MKPSVSILCIAGLGIGLLVSVGCCKSEEPKSEESKQAVVEPSAGAQTPPAFPTPPGLPALPPPGQGGAEPPADLLKALADAQAQMTGGKNADGTPVEQIAWKELSKALPTTAAGWKMDGEIAGSTAKMMGMAVSQAQCKLIQGKSKAQITIVDTTMNPMLAMPFSLARAIEIDSDKETRGPVKFGVHPGTKAFMKKRGKAEVLVMVKNRLLVTVRVEETQGAGSAEELAKNVKFDQLAALIK